MKDKIQELLDSKIIELPPQERTTANPVTVDDDEGEWVVYESKGMKKKYRSLSKAKVVSVLKKQQKPKHSKKGRRTKVKNEKEQKKEKGVKLVPDEPLEHSPHIPITLEEFLPPKLQSLELRTCFDKEE